MLEAGCDPLTKPLKLTDTTFRDAHQSLMATRMRTESMLPIAERMDEVGFFSLEMWGGATFDVCIRFLGENPWERIRSLKRKVQKTPLQMLLRGQNIVGYKNYSDDVVTKFVEKAAEAGIDIFRIFDALNDVRNLQTAIRTVTRVGAHAQGSVCYTISPVHTKEHYVEVGSHLAEMGCDSLCIKDMAGMLAPQPAYELISALKKQVGLPVHLHCHSTSGMVLMTYLKACDAGVDIADTAFSPLAWGTSQPPVETVVAALRGTPYDTRLDLELLVEIGGYFRELREKFFDPANLIDPISERTDTSILIHQIPGGMFSNLVSQLKEQNAMSRLKDVLDEVPNVRKDLGYPPLVTPTSQLVGTQAVFNVLSGERYKIVPNEVRDYVRGLYGKPPAPIAEDVKRKIIGEDELITCRPADLLSPMLNSVPEDAKQFIENEEDLLVYLLFPQAALSYFQKRELRRQREQAEPTGEAEKKNLEEVAAILTAAAFHLKTRLKAPALVPRGETSRLSPWVVAASRANTPVRGRYLEAL